MVTKTNKLLLKDILAANLYECPRTFGTNCQMMNVNKFIHLLNRYVSAIKGKTEDKQLQIFKTNQYYNKNFFTLSSKHKKLLWYPLGMTANISKSIR